MSTKSQADISNSAIRMFLQAVGALYDEARKLPKYSTRGKEWKETLRYFDGRCCYCGVALDSDNSTQDHLVPINRTSLGLHAWGNVVPCCRACNKEKHFGDWREFVTKKNPEGSSVVAEKLTAYQRKYGYMPGLGLKDIANNLYDDVGAVSSALIRLRLEQARDVISSSIRS